MGDLHLAVRGGDRCQQLEATGVTDRPQAGLIA